MSLRDKIFATDDIPKETVEVPEWAVSVEVRGMTGADRAALTEVATDGEGNVNLSAVYPDVVILSSYDPETGERIFQDGDREFLMSKASKALDRLALVGLRLSGFTDDAIDTAGKASSSTPSDASSTA